MRWAARTDANHADIVRGLERVGCSVESLHRVGGGVPDLLVGRAGANYLIELKIDGEGLNKAQRDWHRDWMGQRATARSLEECLRIVGLLA